MAGVVVRVVRPLLYRGRRFEAGAELRVSASDAWLLCSGGRAELGDAERDAAVVRAAVKADVERALKAERTAWRPAEVSPPWERRG